MKTCWYEISVSTISYTETFLYEIFRAAWVLYTRTRGDRLEQNDLLALPEVLQQVAHLVVHVRQGLGHPERLHLEARWLVMIYIIFHK